MHRFILSASTNTERHIVGESDSEASATAACDRFAAVASRFEYSVYDRKLDRRYDARDGLWVSL